MDQAWTVQECKHVISMFFALSVHDSYTFAVIADHMRALKDCDSVEVLSRMSDIFQNGGSIVWR